MRTQRKTLLFFTSPPPQHFRCPVRVGEEIKHAVDVGCILRIHNAGGQKLQGLQRGAKEFLLFDIKHAPRVRTLPATILQQDAMVAVSFEKEDRQKQNSIILCTFAGQ